MSSEEFTLIVKAIHDDIRSMSKAFTNQAVAVGKLEERIGHLETSSEAATAATKEAQRVHERCRAEVEEMVDRHAGEDAKAHADLAGQITELATTRQSNEDVRRGRISMLRDQWRTIVAVLGALSVLLGIILSFIALGGHFG
jgi:hypothetical protein